MVNKEKIIAFVLAVSFSACVLFNEEGELLYKQGRYSIYKKNLISYYNASPDLIVATDKGNIKINLNAFGKRTIPQEKINKISITEINKDSIQIHFTSFDTALLQKHEYISLNVQRTIDSILAMKK